MCVQVATPGRLLDHLQNMQQLRPMLTNVRMFVLDEADRLLDMGFRYPAILYQPGRQTGKQWHHGASLLMIFKHTRGGALPAFGCIAQLSKRLFCSSKGLLDNGEARCLQAGD